MMMPISLQERLIVTAIMVFTLAQPGGAGAQAVEQEQNPFFTEWHTPFGTPPFSEITPDHYLPAFEEAFSQRRAEVQAIVDNPQAPTFANTVEALEQGGDLLARVEAVFFNLVLAETNDQLQAVAEQVVPRLSALEDDIILNQELFSRIKVVYEQREQLDLTADQLRLLVKTYFRFVRRGAEVPAKHRDQLRAINHELASLGIEFSENVRQETNSYRLVIDKQEDLAGLPDAQISAAAEAAGAAGLDGKWVFTLQSPSIWPFLTYADNRELRRQILTAYLTRCNHQNQYDNNQNVVRISSLRAEKAKLLGYQSWAHQVLEENMAQTPQGVYDLLQQLWKPALAKAKQEALTLQEKINEEGGDFKLEPWDWRYYAERVRKERYNIDQEALRPYFEFEKVIDGAFWVVNQLWGLTFSKRGDIPTYNPEIRTYEVFDADGAHLGVLLADYYPRPGKQGGAWMYFYRRQEVRGGHDIRPIVCNVGNISRPTKDQPALLSLGEVSTLYHELGHALHGLLSRCRYRSLSGNAVALDFVELPSAIMQNWLLEPQVLKVYARHYETGEVIPDELIAKIKETSTFNQGFNNVEMLAASFLDMDWHTITAAPDLDTSAFERQSMDAIGLIPQIPVRYRSTYFQHIYGGTGGYAAGYYSYVWSEVLNADAFQAFKENGIFDSGTAASFRRNILARGNSEEAMEMYLRFRGAKPSVKPLLERKGLQ
jgi:peptidyl-dipeptidase Dcp